MKYTEVEVKTLITENNTRIDNFVNSIPEILGKKKLNMNDWFKCQALIEEQKFYKTSKKLLDELRNDGWDIKICMQTYKLYYYGRQ